MRKIIFELGKTFDHIVIDSPPVASFTDGILLAQYRWRHSGDSCQ